MNIKSHLDLFLTEISIELLGNKIYDVNGKRQDKILNIFKALPVKKSSNKAIEANDFLSSLGYRSDFTDNENSVREFLNGQLDFILEDANKSSQSNQEIIDCLRNYKADQMKLLADVSEVNLNKIVERSKLLSQLNKTLLENQDIRKSKAFDEYYEREKNDLLRKNMDTLRLMKYIINDTRNETVKGEMVGFIHAMRSVKDVDMIRTKPYRRRKRSN